MLYAKQSKKEKILDAMQRLMERTHAQAISVSDIAKEAGIGKGSIYYYFKSKEDILEAVIERFYSDAIEKSKNLLDTRIWMRSQKWKSFSAHAGTPP